MSSLEAVLRPAATMINRQIDASTPARELSEALCGRAMAIRVSNTGLAVYMVVEDGCVILTDDYAEDPDVVMCGSLISLLRMAGPAGEAPMRDGDVDISGDALIARQFQKLLRHSKPDLEEELSGITGDIVAHNIGELLRDVADWGRQARTTMGQNVGEYLQEERQAVPRRDEVEEFRGNVERLRDDVARLEARLKVLEASTE